MFAAEVVNMREVDDGVEYYVHYEGKDRRLDEWVPADRVKVNIVLWSLSVQVNDFLSV